MKTIIALFISLLLVGSSAQSQQPTIVDAKLKVSGLCGMCKTRIEKALAIKEVKYAKWDKKSKVLTLAYYSPTISLDSLQQRIAAVGHDTEKFKAPDAVYADLPGCCLYRDNSNTH